MTSLAHISTQVEAGLGLQTDRIDLCFVHNFDEDTPMTKRCAHSITWCSRANSLPCVSNWAAAIASRWASAHAKRAL